MTVPSVAIVILNWNGRKVLEQFLPSVLLTNYSGYKVYVADNASTDDSLAWLQQHYPQVGIIAMDTNSGYAGGYNKALAQVQADYYVLLNSDVEVVSGWLQPMVSLLESDASIGACQPKIRSYSQRTHFEYAGAAGGWLDSFGYPFCRGRIFDHLEEDNGQYDTATPVFWASGAALFIRSRLFHELKGFDSSFFAHQEEIDLCWRLQLAGYKIFVCPQSVVYHLGGGTLPHGNHRKTFLNFRNNLIMLWKNLPLSRKWWVLPLRFTLDGVVAWKELLNGNRGFFGAVIQAHFAFCNWWMFHKKDSLFPAKKKGTLMGMSHKLLPWQYFVRKKRTFKEISEN